MVDSFCPCGVSKAYRDCCGPLHRGEVRAATAEELMRSRFSAFAVHDSAYLLKSWHPSTRPERVAFDPELRWRRLEIVRTEHGEPVHAEGTVEFRAHYERRGRPGEMHEVSRFVKYERAWTYLDGEVG